MEIGRIDICLEVSMMFTDLPLPMEGHPEQLHHLFAYPKKYHNYELVLDPSDKVIYKAEFECKDWTSIKFGHISGKEDISPNMPAPCGLGFVVTSSVDSDHVGDTVT